MDKSIESHVFDTPIESPRELPRKPKLRKWWRFGGQDRSYVSVDADIELDSEASSQKSGDLVKKQNTVFESPEALEIYKPTAKFEGSHRFDPSATWEPEEEKKLVRRVCGTP
jgi:hypothetical protein